MECLVCDSYILSVGCTPVANTTFRFMFRCSARPLAGRCPRRLPAAGCRPPAWVRWAGWAPWAPQGPWKNDNGRSNYTPGLACNYFLVFVPAGFQNRGSGTKLTAPDPTDATKQQIRCLGTLVPMEDVPSQDSAKNTEN